MKSAFNTGTRLKSDDALLIKPFSLSIFAEDLPFLCFFRSSSLGVKPYYKLKGWLCDMYEKVNEQQSYDEEFVLPMKSTYLICNCICLLRKYQAAQQYASGKSFRNKNKNEILILASVVSRLLTTKILSTHLMLLANQLCLPLP